MCWQKVFNFLIFYFLSPDTESLNLNRTTAAADGLSRSESDGNCPSGTLGEFKAEKQCLIKLGQILNLKQQLPLLLLLLLLLRVILNNNNNNNTLKSLPATSGVDQWASATW